jgi:integrase
MWILQYREGSSKKYQTLGLYSKMSKSEAQQEQARIMSEVNARLATDPDPNITFGDFLEGVALPFYRNKWKRSTALTTENRMTYHLAEFREAKLQTIGLKHLQAFLSRKAENLSRSVVAHLRWDLRAVFKLALAEGYTQRDPTASLYTPKEAAVEETHVMTGKEVEQYIAVLDMRERVIAHLAIFAGMRPGEILGLQRKHVSRAAPLPGRHRHAEDGIVQASRRTRSRHCESSQRLDAVGGRRERRLVVRIRGRQDADLARQHLVSLHEAQAGAEGSRLGKFSGAAENARQPRSRGRCRSKSCSRPARTRYRGCAGCLHQGRSYEAGTSCGTARKGRSDRLME